MRTAPNPVLLSEKTRELLKNAILDGKIQVPRSYQADRLGSKSRFNLDLWSRQTGKSQTAAQDCVHLAAETEKSVMCLSASRDLTQELMVKVALYAEVVSGLAGEIQVAVMRGELDEVLYIDENGLRITQTVITLPNGERVIGRPANPRTARGFSMHLKLDEFGMHQDADEIWAAAFPSITSNRIYRCDVMSTPGIRSDDKFAQLCASAMRGESDFDLRKVTIFDAIKAGLDADASALKRNLNDDFRWRREYLCEFVDEAGAFLTYDLIRSCEHHAITQELPADPRAWTEQTLGWDPAAGDLYMGVDIGRRHDLTVFWIGQRIGEILWTRAVVKLRGVPYSQQQAIGDQILTHLPIRRTSVDATGLGGMLAEEWSRRFGAYRVAELVYTNKLKQDLAEGMRPKFQDKTLRIPLDNSIRESLHSVQKIVTAAGNVRFAGERTPDGHADEFWALANLCHAADGSRKVSEVFFV